MGHIVRYKGKPNLRGEIVEVFENGNYLIKIDESHFIYGHKDYWERVL